jgi:hypothetical protein
VSGYNFYPDPDGWGQIFGEYAALFGVLAGGALFVTGCWCRVISGGQRRRRAAGVVVTII